MNNNKAPTNTPYDIIYDEVDHLNKVNFKKAVEKQLVNAIKQPQKVDKDAVLNKDMEMYEEAFRNYFYMTSVLNDAKSNQFFDEAIKEVHPTIKLKAPAKNILKFVNKVFVQELAETCFEVIAKTKSHLKYKDVDQEVVEDAYRLMERRRVKNIKFARLFTDTG